MNMMIRAMLVAVLASISWGVGGCQSHDRATAAPTFTTNQDVDVIRTTYAAIDTLLARAREQPAPSARILVATFVDLDNLTRTGTFGRVSGELASTRLSQRGYATLNVNIRAGAMAVRLHEGQFLLSREIQLLSQEHNAEAALVGTYARAGETLIVSVRLVRIADNVMLAGADYEMPIEGKVAAMLSGAATAQDTGPTPTAQDRRPTLFR